MSEMRSDFRRAMNVFQNNRFSAELESPPMNPFSRRMKEARSLVREAETLFENGAPTEMIIEKINSAQQLVARFLNSDTPDRFQDEIRQIFMICEGLERAAISRGK